MSETTTALFIGGPLDGQWRALQPDHTTIVAPIYPTAGRLPYSTPIGTVRYHLDRIGLFGRHLPLMICDEISPAERDNAVICAIFQRDVARELGAIK